MLAVLAIPGVLVVVVVALVFVASTVNIFVAPVVHGSVVAVIFDGRLSEYEQQS